MKNRSYLSLVLASVVALVALTGCGKNPLAQGDDSGMAVSIPGGAAAQAVTVSDATVASGEVTITRIATGESITKSGTAGSTIRFTKLVSGDYSVNVKLFDTLGALLYEGTSSAAVGAGVTVPVSVRVTAKGGKIDVGIAILEPKLLLHNTLGSDAEVLASVAGPALTIDGPSTYVPSVFGNGILVDVSSSCLTMPASILNRNAGAIELWYTDNGSTAWQTMLFDVLNAEGNNSSGFYLDLGNGMIEGVFNTQTGTGWSNYIRTPGVPMHFAMVWNFSGIENGSDTWRIYINGVVAFHGTGSGQLMNAAGGTLIIGNSWDKNRPANGVIDNIKIWDNEQTDFSERMYE